LNDTSINGVIIGAGAVDLGGASIAVSATSGNLQLGNLRSTGAITVANNDNVAGATHGGIAVVGAVVSTGGAVGLTTGALGTLSVATGDSVSTIGPNGTDLTVAGHSVTNAGSVTSNRDLIVREDSLANTGTMTTTRDLDVASFTSGNALALTSANGLNLTAGRNINLGYNNAGQITVTGLALSANNGAGNVSVNGGTHVVALNDTSINGIITGAGATNLGGSTVTVTVSSGNVTLGNISSSANLLVADTDNTSGAAHGNVNVIGAAASLGGAVNVTSGNLGSVNILANSSLVGQTGIAIVTPNLIVNGNGFVTATTNNLAVQGSGGANNNALAITLASNNASLNASSGNVSLNGTGAGQITVTGGVGTIAAGSSSKTVTFNAGSNAVNVDIGSIYGCVAGTSSQANFTTNAASNNFMLGNFTSSAGNIVAVNTGASGILSVCGNTSAAADLEFTTASTGSIALAAGASATGGTGVNLTTPSLIAGNNASINAATNTVTIISNGANNALNVALGSGSSIVASNGNVVFGSNVPANQGAITVIGGRGAGNILALGASPTVTFNGGSNPVSVSTNEIAGCIHATGSSLGFQTFAGNLVFCLPISTASAVGSGGNISIAANGGAVMMNNINTNGAGAGNTAGSIAISALNGVSFGTITADGSDGASGGSVVVSSSGQNIVGQFIGATGSGAGNGGSITTYSANLQLTGSSGGNSIDVSSSGSGNGGNANITTTSTAPFAVGNGAAGGNGVLGNIAANGTNGGFVTVDSYYAGQVVNSGAMVTANGTSGSGGKVLFEGGAPPNYNSFYSVINGLVQATNSANDSGIVGFNGGHGNVTLIGSGDINGGSVVRAGNLNPNTLEFLPHGAGQISVDSNLVISNSFETNGHFPIPPTPPTPSGGSGGAASTTAITEATTPSTTSSQNTNPLLGFVSASVTTAEEPVFTPSLTATDVTQIFGYANLDQAIKPFGKEDISNGNADTLIHGVKTSASQFDSKEINRLSKSGVKLGSDTKDNFCNVDVGNIVFSPKEDILVGTHEAPIRIASGATVFVMENGHDVAIFDLDQNGPKQVSVQFDKQKFTLEPGRMLLLSRQSTKDFDHVVGEFKAIGYRNPKGYDINGIKVFEAEFSIPSVFTKVRPLKDLLTSGDKADQLSLQRIMKTAVILNEFGAGKSGNSPFRNGDMGR
jgi:hypothetical protein